METLNVSSGVKPESHTTLIGYNQNSLAGAIQGSNRFPHTRQGLEIFPL